MEKLEKKVIRNYPPGTKIISLFGKRGVVSSKDVFRIEGDSIFIHCECNNYLLIYDGGQWAEIY